MAEKKLEAQLAISAADKTGEVFDKVGARFDRLAAACAQLDGAVRAMRAGAQIDRVASVARCGGLSPAAGKEGVMQKCP